MSRRIIEGRCVRCGDTSEGGPVPFACARWPRCGATATSSAPTPTAPPVRFEREAGGVVCPACFKLAPSRRDAGDGRRVQPHAGRDGAPCSGAGAVVDVEAA